MCMDDYFILWGLIKIMWIYLNLWVIIGALTIKNVLTAIRVV